MLTNWILLRTGLPVPSYFRWRCCETRPAWNGPAAPVVLTILGVAAFGSLIVAPIAVTAASRFIRRLIFP